MTTTLAITCIGLILLSLYEHFRRRDAIDRATTEYRIALGFIRDEQCSMPHEFAAVWLDGNQPAMEGKFPEFAPFRTLCLRDTEMEARQ